MIRDFQIFVLNCMRLTHYVRGVLLALMFLLLLCAAAYASVEGMSLWKSIYFSLITALSIGDVAIKPLTTIGEIANIVSGFVGTVLFGLIVAISTKALTAVAELKRQKELEKTST
jgi:hypothetical protein